MESITHLNLVKSAEEVATLYHRVAGNVRKYTNEPYIVHPMGVVEIIRSANYYTNAMLAAGWLHDLLEDTEMTFDLLNMTFGSDVADIVWYVTDQSKPSDGNRAVRKEIDRKHINRGTYASKTVKIADCIHNFISINEHDPKFASTYYSEMRLLYPCLIEGDSILLLRFKELLDTYEQEVV